MAEPLIRIDHVEKMYRRDQIEVPVLLGINQGLAWSMTITSRPRVRASASGSWLVVPQSTVTSSVAPCPASVRIASTLGP